MDHVPWLDSLVVRIHISMNLNTEKLYEIYFWFSKCCMLGVMRQTNSRKAGDAILKFYFPEMFGIEFKKSNILKTNHNNTIHSCSNLLWSTFIDLIGREILLFYIYLHSSPDHHRRDRLL
jgi:hypothetical protein